MSETKHTIVLDAVQTPAYKQAVGEFKQTPGKGFREGLGHGLGGKLTAVDLNDLGNPDIRAALASIGCKGLQTPLPIPKPTPGSMPPKIPGIPSPSDMGGFDWKRMALGFAAGMFSPWVGGRIMNNGPGFGKGGGAGGAGGGFASALFGGGGAMAFGEWYLIFAAARRALEFAFTQMTEAVHRGAQLYLKAAELGTNTQMVSRMQRTFEMMGLPAGTAEKLMASGQFMNGMKMNASSMEGVLLGSGLGIPGKEEFQAVRNLSKEIVEAWNKTATAARQASESSYINFKTSMKTSQLKQEWNTLWEQGAAGMAPLIQGLEEIGVLALQFLNYIQENTVAFQKLIGMAPEGKSADFAKFGGSSGAVHRPVGTWERFGAVIAGGIGTQDYAKQTASATKESASTLSQILKLLAKTDPITGPISSFTSLFNMP